MKVENCIKIGDVFSHTSKKGNTIQGVVFRILNGQVATENGMAYNIAQCVFEPDVMEAIKKCTEQLELLEREKSEKSKEEMRVRVLQKQKLRIDFMSKLHVPSEIIRLPRMWNASIKEEIKYVILKKSNIPFSVEEEDGTDNEYIECNALESQRLKIIIDDKGVTYYIDGVDWRFFMPKHFIESAIEVFGFDPRHPETDVTIDEHVDLMVNSFLIQKIH
jgi:hypothetical protein